MLTELIELLVPQEITEHFTFEGYDLMSGVYRIHMVEKDDQGHIPVELRGHTEVVLDGYMKPLELQTYPLKGKEVFLYLRRRRWKLKGARQSYHNRYDFHAKGMKATRDFGAFLKEIGRG